MAYCHGVTGMVCMHIYTVSDGMRRWSIGWNNHVFVEIVCILLSTGMQIQACW